MSKQHERRERKPAGDGAATHLDFTPVAVRPRVDGWTPERQVGFIQALAATGCVDEAARSVGMTARSARDLRTRRDAASLRTAWQAALATGIGRLAEAALSRAIHGTASPIFFKGEQVGERRRFDERLTTFLLRYHAPERYGAWRDKVIVQRRDPDGAAALFQEAMRRLVADCVADRIGEPRERREPLQLESTLDDPAAQARESESQAELREIRRRAEWNDFERQMAAERAAWEADARAGRSSAGMESSVSDGSFAASQEGKTHPGATGAEVTEVSPSHDDLRDGATPVAQRR